MTLTLTETERRLLLQLVDKAWWESNREREKGLDDLMYVTDLQAIQEKLR